MKKLQAQLNQLAESNKRRVAVVLEGRDTAGKSSTIRAVTEYLNPQWYSIVPSTKPSVTAMANWWQWWNGNCLLYTSPSPRDKRQSRMPSSA